MLTAALIAALVVEEQTPLRAAPQESAAQKAQLSRGDWLEVRGERGGFVQVYDHRRERPGYVRAWQVRRYPVDGSSAPALKAVVDFLRDTPGAESLGIGYAALLLRAAPGPVSSEVLDALGGMAERLARRASLSRSGPGAVAAGAQVAAHLDVAQSYGVHFVHLGEERKGRVCYDGEAYRQVLAMASAPAERARAALGLTLPQCEAQVAGPSEGMLRNERRLALLGQADPAQVPAHLGNRLRLRRAEVESELVFQHARRQEHKQAAALSELAVRELALVARPELQDEDQASYEEVAVRVGAARWAAEPERPVRGAFALRLHPGSEGQTCVRLVATAAPGQVLHERCTYGLVWPASLRVAPRGTAVTLAVQPLAGWVELWVFRPNGPNGPDEPATAGPAEAQPGPPVPPMPWRVDSLPPAPVDPELGYAELAGFSPDGGKLLLAREARIGGSMRRSFQVLHTSTLAVEKQARNAELLAAFKSWQAPDWRGRTLSLR